MSRGPKRSKEQRAKDLQLTAELYLSGYKQVDIASRLGVSQAQISLDLKAIRKMWLASATINFDEAVAQELAKIDNLEREYWQAWRRSITTKTKQRERQTERQEGEGQRAKRVRFAEKFREEEELDGNPAFLAGVQRCIEQRCKLLGLEAPIKSQTEITGKDGGPVQVEGKGSGLALAYYEMPAEQWERINSILLESDKLSGAVRVGGGQTSEAE